MDGAAWGRKESDMTEQLHFLSLRRIVHLQHKEGSSGYLKQPLPIPLGLTRLAESRSLDHYCSLDSYGRLGFCWWGLIWVSDRMVYSCENLNSFTNVEHWGVGLLGKAATLGPESPIYPCWTQSNYLALSSLCRLSERWWGRSMRPQEADVPIHSPGDETGLLLISKSARPLQPRWKTVWRFLKKLKIAVLSWVPILKKQKH